MGLLSDARSKDQNLIEARLQDSYGRPYEVAAKANLGFQSAKTTHHLSTSGGAVLLVTDPVFPDLQGFIYHDYAAHSRLEFSPSNGFNVSSQLSYGVRRYLDRRYTVGDLVEEKIDTNFGRSPYLGFAELSTRFEYTDPRGGQVLFDLTGLPLWRSRYDAWETFIAYRSPVLFGRTSLWGGFSPFYGGSYDVSRTYRVGLQLWGGDRMSMDLFTLDRFYPGLALALNLGPIRLEAMTFERAFDDYGTQRARQYGLNLKLAWM